jgi:hypothetical protein
MKTLSMLLLTGGVLALASVAAPVTAAAQQGKLLVFKVTHGVMHLTIDAPPTKDDVDATTRVRSGCIEIQPGPTNTDLGTPFVLTRLGLRFEDFTINADDTLEKPMTLRHVAAQLLDAVTWRGMPIANAPNVWTIEIAPDGGHGVGEPAFVLGATVDPDYFNGNHNEDVPPLWQGTERASEKIAGVIDLNQGKLDATAVFKHVTEIFPGLDVTRTITVELTGDLVTTQSGTCRAVWTGSDSPGRVPKPTRGR